MPKQPVVSIVDDDESAREGIKDLIKAMGFVAKAFPCAEDFLKSRSRHSTSCLIADMRMPGKSGLELYNHLVVLGDAIPTILMTAFPKERDREQALQAGVIGYLIKPFSAEDLLACIRSALKQRPDTENES